MNSELPKMDKAGIIRKIKKATDAQFEVYSWKEMINDCGLTLEEKKWAMEHIYYKVVNKEDFDLIRESKDESFKRIDKFNPNPESKFHEGRATAFVYCLNILHEL